MAAGLAAMVAGMSRGKKAYAKFDAELTEALAQLDGLREELKAAIDADAAAYEAVVLAYKAQKNAAQAGTAAPGVAAALRGAAGVPLRVAQCATEVSSLAMALRPKTNPRMGSDLTVAAALARAAMETLAPDAAAAGVLVVLHADTAVAMTASGGTAATAPVTGSPYTITPGAAAGTNGFLAANYNIAYNAGSLTVNPLPAVLTGTRAYDGTSIALSSILTVSNDISPDVVAVVSGSAPLAGASVGTNVILSAGALQLGGAQAADYTLTPLGGGAVIITNGFNPFSITSAAWDAAGSNLVVCWTSVPGVSYNVLTNHCLAATGSWGDAGAASHPASAVTATDTNTCVAIPVRTIGNTHVYLMIKQ